MPRPPINVNVQGMLCYGEKQRKITASTPKIKNVWAQKTFGMSTLTIRTQQQSSGRNCVFCFSEKRKNIKLIKPKSNIFVWARQISEMTTFTIRTQQQKSGCIFDFPKKRGIQRQATQNSENVRSGSKNIRNDNFYNNNSTTEIVVYLFVSAKVRGKAVGPHP